MLVDSHCHLDFPDFAGELDAVVARARAAGIGAHGHDLDPRQAARATCSRSPSASPTSTARSAPIRTTRTRSSTFDAPTIVARTRHPKVVAIGEAGLDYHYDNSPRDAQERGFRNHIAAARETGLPLVIHSREADDDMARILEEETGKGAFPAVLHCFTGGPELARRAIALGLSISFTGILTFKKSDELRAIAASLPADRILVETDAPYLAPGTLSRQAQRAGLCGRDRQGAGGGARRQLRRDRPADHREFLPAVPKVPRPAAAAGGMSLRFTILGCGSSGGVPRPALGWGACDPNNPKNRRRRTSLLVERQRRRRRDPRSWSTPRRTCASSFSTPRSIGSTPCSTPTSTPTTPTASTTCAGSSSTAASACRSISTSAPPS